MRALGIFIIAVICAFSLNAKTKWQAVKAADNHVTAISWENKESNLIVEYYNSTLYVHNRHDMSENLLLWANSDGYDYLDNVDIFLEGNYPDELHIDNVSVNCYIDHELSDILITVIIDDTNNELITSLSNNKCLYLLYDDDVVEGAAFIQINSDGLKKALKKLK